MMKKIILSTLILILAGIAGTGWYVYFWKPNHSFWQNLEGKIHGGQTEVPLSILTDFEWDKVCLFYGYDSPTAMQTLAAEGISNFSAEDEQTIQSIEKESDIRLLVFSSNGTVAKTIYLRSPIVRLNDRDFDLSGPTCAAINQAIFVLEQKNNHWVLWLKDDLGRNQ